MKLRHAPAPAFLLPLACAAGLLGCSGSPSSAPRARDADKGKKEGDKGTASRPEDKGEGKPEGKGSRKPDTGKKPPNANPSVEVVKGGDGVIRGQIDPKSNSGVVVWLAKPPAEALPCTPELLILRQSRGNLVPHLAVRGRGSNLELRTADERASFQGSGAATFSRAVNRGKSQTVSLDRSGLVVVRSGDPAQMTPAYIHVLDHAYYDISDGEGEFKLPRVPPGDYEVWLWHEGWVSSDPKHPGNPVKVKVGVKVAPGAGAAIRWALPPRPSGS